MNRGGEPAKIALGLLNLTVPAKSILRDGDAAVEQTRLPTPEQTQHRQATDTLRTELNTKTRQVAQLRKRLEAAATVIATLYHENYRTASPTRQARHRGAHRSPIATVIMVIV